jgi:hypothetical protein
MPLQRNIDGRGKRVRFISGIGLVIAGTLMLWLWSWLISTALIVVGAFAIVEALAGWCVLRALGFRTRL